MPTMTASYKLWPVAHLVNFALVPPAYRVLYTNLVSVSRELDTVIARTEHQQRCWHVRAMPSPIFASFTACVRQTVTLACCAALVASTAVFAMSHTNPLSEQAALTCIRSNPAPEKPPTYKYSTAMRISHKSSPLIAGGVDMHPF